jgi:hypothetical protein
MYFIIQDNSIISATVAEPGASREKRFADLTRQCEMDTGLSTAQGKVASLWDALARGYR